MGSYWQTLLLYYIHIIKLKISATLFHVSVPMFIFRHFGKNKLTKAIISTF